MIIHIAIIGIIFSISIIMITASINTIDRLLPIVYCLCFFLPGDVADFADYDGESVLGSNRICGIARCISRHAPYGDSGFSECWQ